VTAGPGGGPEGGPWTEWASRAERAAREFRAGRGHPDAHIRVSDAERSAVADQLSAHFAAGRLDQAEFDERMSQAMAAKTRGELPALLADLPPAVPPPAPARERGGRTLLLVALALVVAASLAAAFSAPGPHLRLGWVPVAIVVLIVLRVRHRRRYPR
jgi:hypothetical protein